VPAEHIIAAVRPRTRENKEQISFNGAKVIEVSTSDPQDRDIAKHLDRVGKMFIIPPNDDANGEEASAFIDAATHAKVPFVCLLSVIDPKHRHDLMGNMFLALEALLARTELEYAILRAGFYLQNFLLIREDVGNGRLRMPLGEGEGGRFAPTDHGDVSRVAARILAKSEPWKGKTVSVMGPRLVTAAELAQIASTVLGKTVTYENVPADTTRQYLKEKTKISDTVIDSIVSQCEAVAAGRIAYHTAGFKEVMASEATDIEAFFKEFHGLFGGGSDHGSVETLALAS